MSSEILALERIPGDGTERWGGKATNLGRLIRLGVRVPPGLCIAAEALERTLALVGVQAEIDAAVRRLDYGDFAAVEAETKHIRGLIEHVAMPDDLRGSIGAQLAALTSANNPFVAVRSSVAVRGTSISLFPGMMDTYHYVLGADEVIDSVRQCWASLWSARAVHGRHHKNIAHADAVIAPIIQLMVNSESAGVLFTANPISKDLGECVVEANWGIGESVVSGRSMTDSFILDKAAGRVKQRAVMTKNLMVVMDDGKGRGRKEVPVPPDRAGEPALSDAQLAELCAAGRRIEEHFAYPADIEWAFQHDQLYILQARRIRNLERPELAGQTATKGA